MQESSPIPIGSNSSHPRGPMGLSGVQEEGGAGCVSVESSTGEQTSEKKLKYTREPIAFDDNGLEGTIQPHDDALVVAAQINGFIVKRVLIDQGSGVEVMYPDLFTGLGLKNKDLT